ncbi:MAG TPA: IS4 family transposase [Saprospiraceae bacterium]|nr:IS4 family transposase [Saprospiraceae bacterium]
MRTSYSDRHLTNDEFGDLRLKRRYQKICSQLEVNLSSTIPRSCQTRSATKAVYRFFDNEHVLPQMIIKAHWDTVLPCMQAGDHKRLLQLTDTVEFDFTKKRSRKALGPLNYPFRRGTRAHNSMITTEKGVPMGLLLQSHHLRSDEDFGKAAERQSTPFEEKESYRWCEHFIAGQSLCEQNPNIELVYVADREADIMELYLARSCERMHFVVRAQHNRKLEDKSDNLYHLLSEQAAQGTYKVVAYDPKTLKQREATVEIRFCKVNLKLHNTLRHKKNLPGIELCAIQAKEVDPPADVEKPVFWVLLTTLPVETYEDAMLIIQYYTTRWLIERFHFLLKSGGANVEELQLETSHRIQNALTTYSTATFNVFKIRYLAEKNPNMPIYEAGISPVEHKVLYQYANKKISASIAYDPQNQPTIFEYCVVLGQIGGFFPSKRQPIPGLKILSRAVEQLQHLVDAYLLFCQRTE